MELPPDAPLKLQTGDPMASNTKIEWCDHTFNPWTGCTKVSPGCGNCYAEGWSKRSGIVTWGPGHPRRRTSEANWKLPLKWNRDAARELENFEAAVEAGAGYCGGMPRRPRVFCASLADWLDDEVPTEWLSDLLYLMIKCNHLDWLLLTKRPQLWQSRLREVANGSDIGAIISTAWLNGDPPRNIWIGTTVEDQQRAKERIPSLIDIPAKVRFLSCEPLLGPVDLRRIHDDDGNTLNALTGDWGVEGRGHTGPCGKLVHWVICGGESGPKARPMHPGWAMDLRDQCQQDCVPFLFKQWGEWLPRTGGIMSEADLTKPQQERIRLSWDAKNSQTEACDPSGDIWMGKVGKKAAGRLLDEREWNEFPAI